VNVDCGRHHSSRREKRGSLRRARRHAAPNVGVIFAPCRGFRGEPAPGDRLSNKRGRRAAEPGGMAQALLSGADETFRAEGGESAASAAQRRMPRRSCRRPGNPRRHRHARGLAGGTFQSDRDIVGLIGEAKRPHPLSKKTGVGDLATVDPAARCRRCPARSRKPREADLVPALLGSEPFSASPNHLRKGARMFAICRAISLSRGTQSSFPHIIIRTM